MSRSTYAVFGIAAAVLLSCATTASAAAVTFEIDPERSSLMFGGTMGGALLETQGPGSNLTSYTGKIVADVSDLGISFPGGSTIDARVQPGELAPGPGAAAAPALAPADYGMKSTPFATDLAVRDFIGDVAGGPFPLSGTGFAANGGLLIAMTSGTADYRSLYNLPQLTGTRSLANLSGPNRDPRAASLEMIGAIETLTIPISTTMLFGLADPNRKDSSITLSGKIVATRAVPEPAGVGIVGLLVCSATLRRPPTRSRCPGPRA